MKKYKLLIKVAVIKIDNRGPSIWEGHELADFINNAICYMTSDT